MLPVPLLLFDETLKRRRIACHLIRHRERSMQGRVEGIENDARFGPTGTVSA